MKADAEDRRFLPRHLLATVAQQNYVAFQISCVACALFRAPLQNRGHLIPARHPQIRLLRTHAEEDEDAKRARPRPMRAGEAAAQKGSKWSLASAARRG